MSRRDRARVKDAFVRAIRRFDLAGRTAAAVDDVSDRAPGGVLVIAIGKAAPAMARGAASRLRSARGIVVVTDGTPCALDRRRFEIHRAGHPLPDARSLRAAARILERARAHEGALVVLVSGGASALVCAPVAGLSLENKRAVVRRLLRADASIEELNVVRRHLSRIKGGGLLRVARGAVFTVIASDVLGGGLHDVGSGISVVDPTSVRDARRVARRRGLGELPFVETCKAPPPGVLTSARVVASPELFARAVADELRRKGLRVRVGSPQSGSVDALAHEYEKLSRTLARGEARVFSAEPVVRVRASRPGRGGRSSHLAALVAPRLAPGVVFLAGASDGADGSSRAAGAVVDATCTFVDRDRALARFDTAPLHERAGTAIVTGATGINFADVHILARLE
jgi:hydroxypyruvate reductase